LSIPVASFIVTVHNNIFFYFILFVSLKLKNKKYSFWHCSKTNVLFCFVLVWFGLF
jgi:hypothetical protein